MTIEHPHYPIVYVRGYAATMGEMEETVATPYMGFNLGSTKIRQDFDNRIRRFIFESPLIRLMKDEGYVDAYRDGDFTPPGTEVPSRSVWIYRYYEPSTKSLGDGEKEEIEEYARGLGEFIDRIRESVCQGDPEEESKFRVHLVAHSMGGLIARCYLQNIRRGGAHHVDKLFTYGTPHNGIEMLGLNVPKWLGGFNMNNFNRKRMADFLGFADGHSGRVDSLDGAFPPERAFAFVGTNYRDYEAFFGLSKKGTGPLSDGLVMISNATMHGAPRAFAHRSHSGHFGIVNSEEGYQNLRRFLFGQVRVDVQLLFEEVPLPPKVQEAYDRDHDSVRANYDVDVRAAVRGGNVVLHERTVQQASAVRVGYDRAVKQGVPAYLFSGFLHKAGKAKGATDTALGFGVSLGINVPVFEIDRRFWFDEHFEGAELLREQVTFHVRERDGAMTVRYGFARRDGANQAPRRAEISEPGEDGARHVDLPLGFKEGISEARKPRPGFRGKLRLRLTPWNREPS